MFNISGETATFSVDFEASVPALLDLRDQAIQRATAFKVLLATREILGPQVGFMHLAARGKLADVQDFCNWIRAVTDTEDD